jgi:hypothetical protein
MVSTRLGCATARLNGAKLAPSNRFMTGILSCRKNSSLSPAQNAYIARFSIRVFPDFR